MGIHPTIFGPYVWAAIHLICLGAPKHLDEHQKTAYKKFFMLLPSVIPCRNCGNHLQENLQHVPIDDFLNSNTDLFTWSVKLHNIVNLQLHKPQLSEIEAETFWSSGPHCDSLASSNGSSFETRTTLYYFLILCFGIIIGIISNKLYKKQSLKK
jgi:hypothetical protein